MVHISSSLTTCMMIIVHTLKFFHDEHMGPIGIHDIHTVHLATKSVCESHIKNRIKTLLLKDEFFNQIIKGLQQEPNENNYEGYKVEADNLLLYNNRLYLRACSINTLNTRFYDDDVSSRF